MRIAHWGLIILLVLSLETASAQQQQQTSSPSDQQQSDSLAAAARRAQDQKKDQKKAAKVWDNDNIPSTPGAVSVVGATPPPADANATVDNASANPPADGSASNTAGTPDKPAEHVDVGAMQAQLKTLKNELDILQRKYTLDQQTYYGTTNYAADKAGAAALQDEKAQIDAKQQEIDGIQKTLDNLH
jgi:hypothetical protein